MASLEVRGRSAKFDQSAELVVLLSEYSAAIIESFAKPKQVKNKEASEST